MHVNSKILKLAQNWMYVFKVHVSNKRTKSQSIISLGRAMADKPGKADDVTFWTSFVGTLTAVRQNKRHFWNPDTKLDNIYIYFKRNF